MKNILENYNNNLFEGIRHIDESGNEYWLARELQYALGYKQWRSIEDLIEKAINACRESKYNIKDHFALQRKMIILAKGAKRSVIDYKLSRYACYLIAMNGNPNKKVIALAQTYFAIQTRKQELSEREYSELSEDEKRLMIRKKVKEENLDLRKTAIESGVKNLAEFHNFGYKGLYNGETANDIFKRKGLRYREDILDNMGSEELAANLFRITQIDSKIKREKIIGETNADNAHFIVGKNVREAIKKNGGTMPEDLPTPKKSIKEIEKK